jgi:hypothetical protein
LVLKMEFLIFFKPMEPLKSGKSEANNSRARRDLKPDEDLVGESHGGVGIISPQNKTLLPNRVGLGLATAPGRALGRVHFFGILSPTQPQGHRPRWGFAPSPPAPTGLSPPSSKSALSGLTFPHEEARALIARGANYPHLQFARAPRKTQKPKIFGAKRMLFGEGRFSLRFPSWVLRTVLLFPLQEENQRDLALPTSQRF